MFIMSNETELSEPLSPIIKRKRIKKYGKPSKQILTSENSEISSSELQFTNKKDLSKTLIDEEDIIKEFKEDLQHFDGSFQDNEKNKFDEKCIEQTPFISSPQPLKAENDVESFIKNSSQIEINSFKTASGKPISNNLENINYAKNLFSDLFSLGSSKSRPDKHSFISKDFFGFEKDETIRYVIRENQLNNLINYHKRRKKFKKSISGKSVCYSIANSKINNNVRLQSCDNISIDIKKENDNATKSTEILDHSKIKDNLKFDDIFCSSKAVCSTPKSDKILSLTNKNISKSIKLQDNMSEKENIKSNIFADFNLNDVPDICKATFSTPKIPSSNAIKNNATPVSNNTKVTKNIFSDFNFEDIPNFSKAVFQSPQYKPNNDQLNINKKLGKSCFSDFNFDDISNLPDAEFKTPQLKQNNTKLNSDKKLGKSCFSDFNFDDIPNLPDAEFKTLQLKQNDKQLNSDKKLAKSCFSDFNFDDIPNISKVSFEKPKMNANVNEIIKNKALQTHEILDKPKSLFNDFNFDDLNLQFNRKPEKSFVSPLSKNDSSYIKKSENKSYGTPGSSKCFSSFRNSSLNVNSPNNINSPISAHLSINKRPIKLNDLIEESLINEPNVRLTLQKPTSGNPKVWYDELEHDKIILEQKLNVIYKKQNCLQEQIIGKTTKETKDYNKINEFDKISLQELQRMENLEEYTNKNVSKLYINPQNAVLVHFFSKSMDGIVTYDNGCVIIPNKNNAIGISEIEAAFSVMPGIKKNLIPNGWVKNHYKWIVWKLASYEIFFPALLGNSLTIENITNQLKLRYNKELFNASRPALRKILEKDDAPQKRLVLCVSNIFKDKNRISELELTDGWYSIRTIIDKQLALQVEKGRIIIGLKLMICGAELLNCTGCSPLENDALKARLKINFNSTKRAAWYAKLGFQKNANAFPVSLTHSHIFGGKIGCTEVYILRIYPILFVENSNNHMVWRNENNENKRAQQFEILQSNNPSLTRNVIPVLKIAVLDKISKKQPFKLYIWQPNDNHFDYIKENTVYQIYNITMRSNFELNTNKMTYFNIKNCDITEFEGYKRKYVEISDYDYMFSNSVFGEIDTVGVIVTIKFYKNIQYIWVTNIKKCLLLIQTSDNVVFNRIQEKNSYSFCDIVLNDYKGKVVRTTATCNTLISSRSKNDVLNKEIELLNSFNEAEIDKIIKECKTNIQLWEIQFANEIDEMYSGNIADESVLSITKITSTDVAMSLIDIEDVINKTK